MYPKRANIISPAVTTTDNDMIATGPHFILVMISWESPDPDLVGLRTNRNDRRHDEQEVAMAEEDGRRLVFEAMGIDWWRSLRFLGFLISSSTNSIPSLTLPSCFTSITLLTTSYSPITHSLQGLHSINPVSWAVQAVL